MKILPSQAAGNKIIQIKENSLLSIIFCAGVNVNFALQNGCFLSYPQDI